MEEQFSHQGGYEITHRDFKFKENSETEPCLKLVVPSERNEHYVIGMEPAAAKVLIQCRLTIQATCLLYYSMHTLTSPYDGFGQQILTFGRETLVI